MWTSTLQGILVTIAKLYIYSKDAVDKLYTNDDAVFRGNHLERLNSTYKELQRKGKDLFGTLIERKDLGEEIKDALFVLDKYRFIFYLPSHMKENWAKV